ncbi:MAG: hypothetical protein N4A33_07555 [Bacteriovoracaceae bacterium]|jgi:hypothetical protein|nr:hypothetical protein [Bacteriovoracaceae bacterium]
MYGFLLVLISNLVYGANLDHFSSNLTSRWSYSTKVYEKEAKHNDAFAKLPTNIWIELLSFDFLTDDFKETKDCLLYKKNDGIISLKVVNTDTTCNDYKSFSTVSLIGGIHNFKYKLSKEKVFLYIDKNTIEIKMLNIGNYKKELYSNSFVDSEILGIKFVSNIKAKALTYILKDKEQCKKVNNKCEVIYDNCNRCKKSSYHIIDSKCSSKTSKVCGMDRCGQKNRPACIRGFKAVNYSSSSYCMPDSPFGFCQKGLRVYCENKRLVCR